MNVWKVLGLGALASAIVAGVAVERRRRTYRAMDTDELRAKLHARLAAAQEASA